jgi:hypothetical protein
MRLRRSLAALATGSVAAGPHTGLQVSNGSCAP